MEVFMKMLRSILITMFVASVYFGCELKDDKDEKCRKEFEEGLIGNSMLCSDPAYVASQGFADYNECIDFNSQLGLIIFSDCKAQNSK